MLRDIFRLQRAAECDPTDCEKQRYFAACRGVPTSGVKSFSYWAPSLRAIAARLQAEHIPPLGFLMPFCRTRARQVAQPSPRTGKGDRVSGGRGLWTDGQGLYSIGSPHKRRSPACGGAKRGMPVASPGVARRAERGPWTRTCAYFDLHGNDKLLRAVTPSVSCADSFPQGDAICTSPSLPRARGRGTAKRWKRSMDGRGRTIHNCKSSQASQPRARGREARDAGGIPGCGLKGRKRSMDEDLRIFRFAWK